MEQEEIDRIMEEEKERIKYILQRREERFYSRQPQTNKDRKIPFTIVSPVVYKKFN